MEEARKQSFRRLASTEEQNATMEAERRIDAERKLSKGLDPIQRPRNSLLPTQSFDSKIPVPTPASAGVTPEAADPAEPKEKMKFSMNVFRFATPADKMLVALGILMNIANGTTMPIFTLVFGDMMNSFGDPRPGDRDVNYYVLMQVYIGIASLIVSSIGAASLDLAAERQIRDMRHHYLDAVMRQEMGWFDTFDSGTLASQLNQNCVNIRDGIGMKLGQLFMFMAMFVGGYIIGFIRGWQMALVLSAALPLLAAAGYFMMMALKSTETRSQKAYSMAGSVAEEVLGCFRTVVAFGSEEKSLLRYDVHLDDSMKLGVRGGLVTGVGLGSTLGVMFLSYALGFWYGGKLVADGAGCQGTDCFRGGNALSVFFAVIIAAFSLGQAGPPMTSFLKAGAAANDLFELIERKSLIDPSSTEGKKGVPLKGDIVFKNVKFFYPSRPEKPIFGGIDLHIPAGKTVALVGGSGCGKSTAIQLVQRFYDPAQGQVLVDGIDLKDYNLSWIRDQMSLVSQEPRLFARSIAENIRDGRLSATQNEIETAAKNANALGYISQFPEGFDTFVGEGGSQLSGGQKQRIAIARAMLRDPKILILDEATSALDNESEKIVQDTLDSLVASSSRTTIIIAHRLSTIRNADKIIVLDNSDGLGAKVAEEGTHDELVAIPDGIYANLVTAQKLQGVSEVPHNRKMSHVSHTSSIARQDSSKLENKLSQLLHRQSSVRSESKKQDSMQIEIPQEIRESPKPPGYWRVMSLLKPHWVNVALGILGSMLAGITFPMFAVIFSQFISVYFLPNPDDVRSESNFYSLMFIALAASCFISTVLQKTFMEWAGQRLVRELRSKTFESMLYQDIGFFDDPNHTTGTLSQILSSDVLLVKGWSGDNLGIIVQNVTALVAGIVIAFMASPKLAAVAMAAFLILVPAEAAQMKFQMGNSKELEEGAQTAGYVINETITNIRIVTAYNLQKRMLDAYDLVLADDYKSGSRNALVGGIFWGLAQFIQFGAQALALWYGSELMKAGEIKSVGDMLRAIFALMMAAMGIGQSMVFMTDVKKAKDGAARVYEVLDRKPLIDARSNVGTVLTPDTIKGAIEISSVNFRYPQRQDVSVFKNISFSVTPGETVALVGSSGCGKSTIIQLLERFYDVEGGETKAAIGGTVKVDGIDVRDATVKSLRSVMGLVSQEPILFNTTITENIRYGKPGATEAEIVAAAKMANAHDFISQFPEGYNTLVGKFGGQLSGGQKQRIAIARAMLRNPKILLLDEATSALDAESEKIVQEALDRLLAASKRTTIVVAHRLSTIQNADKIVVLANPDREGSAVVEVGKHDELMKNSDGVYRGLVNIASAADNKRK